MTHDAVAEALNRLEDKLGEVHDKVSKTNETVAVLVAVGEIRSERMKQIELELQGKVSKEQFDSLRNSLLKIVWTAATAAITAIVGAIISVLK